jgi:hypothetical protein
MQPTASNPVITVIDSIDQFHESERAVVTGGQGFYSSVPWNRFLENDPAHDVWYVAARGADGVLLGVLPVYVHAGGPRSSVDHNYDPGIVFGQPPAASTPLLVGGRAGYETRPLLRPDLTPAERARVLDALVQRCRRMADAWGLDGLASMYLTSAAAHELGPAFATGEPRITGVCAVIGLEGMRSLDDFTSPMSKKRRYRIVREIRDFEASSFRLRAGRLSDWCDVVGQLLAEHHRRFGHDDTPAMMVDHFTRQAAHLDELSHVLVCERAGVPVGFALNYEWEGTWYLRAAGAADGLRGASAAFFNFAYYAPIRAALERGIRRYDVGPTSLQTKLLRGARLEPRWSLVSGDDDLDRGAQWNDAQLARWEAELAGMHPPVADAWRRELQLSR